MPKESLPWKSGLPNRDRPDEFRKAEKSPTEAIDAAIRNKRNRRYMKQLSPKDRERVRKETARRQGEKED